MATSPRRASNDATEVRSAPSAMRNAASRRRNCAIHALTADRPTTAISTAVTAKATARAPADAGAALLPRRSIRAP